MVFAKPKYGLVFVSGVVDCHLVQLLYGEGFQSYLHEAHFLYKCLGALVFDLVFVVDLTFLNSY
jgi:hypothetical protein